MSHLFPDVAEEAPNKRAEMLEKMYSFLPKAGMNFFNGFVQQMPAPENLPGTKKPCGCKAAKQYLNNIAAARNAAAMEDSSNG